ncbi:MAG: hypothetical protein HY332_06450 [Chloroflexi bacterium]|nr:hypothetical protein [Chloroflexota bacterium]
MVVNIPGWIATTSAALIAAVRRVLSLPPKPTAAEQRAEAERAVESAARREAADEVIRATSRRVMNEMWPARPAAAPAAPAVATATKED